MAGLEYLVKARWEVEFTFHNGLTVYHYLDEIKDLHSIVERGPNFYLIDKIEVRLNAEREEYRDCRKDALENSDLPFKDYTK